MPEEGKRIFWTVEGPAFDMRALIRLGIWGGLASLAMGLAVISAYSGTGSQRTASQQGPAVSPELVVQTSQTAADVRRLSEAVRGLMVDREQLLNRVASLEHGLDDVTGSLKRDAAAGTVQQTTTAASLPVIGAPAVTTPRQDTATSPAQASSTSEATPQSQPAAVATRVVEAESEPAAAPSGLGVDVGGAVSFEGLRTLWASTRRNNPDLPEDIFPIVAVRENSKSHNVDLRLVIGPLANSEAAARLCVSFLAAHRYCQTVAFEGQRLSLAEPAAKSGTAAASHRPPLGP